MGLFWLEYLFLASFINKAGAYRGGVFAVGSLSYSQTLNKAEAIFLIVYDPFMNELWAT